MAVLNLFDEPKSRGCKVKKGNWLSLLISIGMKLKVEGVGEIWVASARGQDGEVELTIMPCYHSWVSPLH